MINFQSRICCVRVCERGGRGCVRALQHKGFKKDDHHHQTPPPENRVYGIILYYESTRGTFRRKQTDARVGTHVRRRSGAADEYNNIRDDEGCERRQIYIYILIYYHVTRSRTLPATETRLARCTVVSCHAHTTTTGYSIIYTRSVYYMVHGTSASDRPTR